MQKLINPNPIVAQLKSVLLAIILTGVVYYFRGTLQDLTIQAMILVWGLTILECAGFFVMSRFVSLEVRDSDMLVKKGMLNVSTSIVPYRNITDARYSQALVERLFGLGTLEIDTAGSQDTIRIYSIRSSDADEILQNLGKRQQGVVK